MNFPALKPDSKYIFQMIKKEDGRKTKPIIATVNELIYALEKSYTDDPDGEGQMWPEDLYVDFIADVDVAMNLDENSALTDFMLTIPLFSGVTFIKVFKEPESYARFKKDREKEEEEVPPGFC